ncbi:MAG: hypothetical protein AUJ72_03430 [Candidatus Omnitrophica bacterium CG1_02_46_14]|nr:MAG: hypothetical protein AUJ72_03430 [Candidatus Omnitrophica bacterium CG1_02_46_14]
MPNKDMVYSSRRLAGKNMTKDPKFKVLVITVCVLMMAGCHPKKNGTLLVKFGSETITKEEFTEKLHNLPKEIQSVAIQRKSDFIQEMVNERFLEHEAEKRKLQDFPDVKSLLAAAHQKIIVAKLIEIEVDKKFKWDPNEAVQYYESHKEEFMAPLLLKASHILMSSEEEARSVKAQLEAGADFETLAKSRSTDNTATRGGDIGYFQKGQLIPEFEDHAFKLKKGEMSPVFKSQFGYHILKLTDRIEPSLKDFKVIKPQLERKLLNEKRTKAFKIFVDKIKGNTKVEIDQKVLDSISEAALKSS